MIWHILKKDLRLLRLPAAMVTLLAAALAQLDIWRYDYEAGLAETALSILLPLAWSMLIALAVHQEPLTSDTAFWLTRPYRRPPLLAAKVLFALLTVHLPILVANSVVLGAHGFSPFASVLLWKQVHVLFLATVPSLAIASVTSSLAAFSWCALAVGVCALLLDAAVTNATARLYSLVPSDSMSLLLAGLVMATGAVIIIGLQYARRTRWLARSVGLGTAAAAALLYSYLPRDLTSRMTCAFEADLRGEPTVRLAPNRSDKPPAFYARGELVAVALPVQVGGVDNTGIVAAEQISIRVSPAGQEQWEQRKKSDFMTRASLTSHWGPGASWQVLMLDRRQLTSSAPTRVEGRATVRPFRMLPPVELPPTFAHRDVPGLGRCSASIGSDTFTGRMLKVMCESPGKVPGSVRVVLKDPQTGNERVQVLGDSYRGRAIPVLDWLSPIQRRQTFFHLVEADSGRPGDRWLVPASALPRSRLRIEPAVAEGCANVEYAFDVDDLRKWIVPPRR
jgi:hypothetical protein